MAWSYPLRFRAAVDDCVQNHPPVYEITHDYQKKIANIGSVPKKTPSTAGAGNKQKRKPKWKSPSKAVRLPTLTRRVGKYPFFDTPLSGGYRRRCCIKKRITGNLIKLPNTICNPFV